jgi:catalase
VNTHQVVEGDVPQLTTQQGVKVADDQNSLKVGVRGWTVRDIFTFERKSSTVITSVSTYRRSMAKSLAFARQSRPRRHWQSSCAYRLFH